jgi:hypothetical protein
MATPAIGDNIIESNEVMRSVAAAREHRPTTPTVQPAQDANPTGSDFGTNRAPAM